MHQFPCRGTIPTEAELPQHRMRGQRLKWPGLAAKGTGATPHEIRHHLRWSEQGKIKRFTKRFLQEPVLKLLGCVGLRQETLDSAFLVLRVGNVVCGGPTMSLQNLRLWS